MDTIDRCASALAQIINELLDVARLRDKKVQLHREKIIIAGLLQRALNTMQSVVELKQMTMICDLTSARQAIVDVDPAQMEQVFWNLLSNALKFTPDGGRIEVSTTITQQEVNVCIGDNGAGFAPEWAPWLFDRFQMGMPSSKGGLGLGLTIAKEIIDLHGGAITAESAGPGQGATFTVSLPLAKE